MAANPIDASSINEPLAVTFGHRSMRAIPIRRKIGRPISYGNGAGRIRYRIYG